MKGTFSSFLYDRSGAAAAEMALVLPLLIVILFAGFEGGHFMWSEHKVVKAVRDGARYAGRQSLDACTAGIANQDNIQILTRTGTLDPTAAPVVPGWTDNSTVTVSISCDAGTTTGIYKSQASGAPRVTVSASVPYPDLFGSIGFPTDGLILNAEAEAAVMGL